ncbi:hypothetical protein ASG33_21505 [Dyadobacter sp. Leaf189]|nr:hypothetical protein ASG33_21505 [Dyadobacter sp. Leaf189]
MLFNKIVHTCKTEKPAGSISHPFDNEIKVWSGYLNKTTLLSASVSGKQIYLQRPTGNQSAMEITSDSSWANARDQAALSGFFEEYRVRSAEIEALLSLIQKQPALQHGTYHWRAISEDGTDFRLSGLSDEQDTCVLAWSRIFEASEILCVINLHRRKEAVVYVTVDDGLHASGTRMNRMLGPGSIPGELNVEDRNGKSIRLTIPPRGLVMYG